ncbi:prolyl oligopeptidase family serine peptidase [Sphingobacterium sp. DK4209]|uniref:prolyl oligopeptidase n=1 Tax=Sphingobacterium zhuxiongii TaxID=2662364 RepID=A0A5Q0QDA3_9SPHI|nr:MULTISPECIES: prolyl oligopeptidase family serine peptidase [unclassified Sphingobacterium]MVZ64813.1 prolyl oligopeptidase family serine peptidase [Sphingobacterium sp. DK4209]QGA25160.1 prolyl oligopeptidase family serine peptidase [Sphingobacterium sp. dk4302]
MRKILSYAVLVVGISACNQEKTIDSKTDITVKPYPKSQKGTQQDNYFGTLVDDPYRWLEDDLSGDTKNWIKAENEVTDDYLGQIPYREQIRARLEKLWNYEKEGAPFKEGEYIYYYKNDGLQNQHVLYRKKGENGVQEVFLDPNQFSTDGTTSLAGVNFSKDGSLVAYQISEGGSDWRKVIIMKTEDKSIVGDTLVDVKFSGLAWKGNEGIFYSSYDKPKQGSELSALTDQHKLYFHKLNTAQATDELIFGGAKTPRRYVGGYLTEDERFLIVTAANTTSGNELYAKDLTIPNAQFVTVVDNMEKNHSILDNDGTKLLIYTELNAPNGRVVTTEFSSPTSKDWKDIIPEVEQVLSPSLAGGKIFATYLKDAISQVKQFDKTGKLEREIELPGIGTASGFSGKKTDNELYYSFTNYVNPGTIYKYQIASGKSDKYKEPAIQFDFSNYESKQVFYTSKDGTKVPMIITYMKGVKLDGTNPTMLYAYGGFNVSLTPSFSVSTLILLEQGGVYAVANLRGGGEYGENWHIAGTKLKKQNVFDDFIAAAEYLISEKYTSSEKLAIAGGSNGGLLVGAVMTQRPELYKVAFPAVGVLDMLRYHKFTAGAGWAFDYGTADDNAEMFKYLYRYSPYHALKAGTAYPATMVTTADHDDRVVPAHSFKFAARLQEYNTGKNPVLIRIDTKAGHGAGKSTEMVIAEQTDKWAFMFQNMDFKYKDISK